MRMYGGPAAHCSRRLIVFRKPKLITIMRNTDANSPENSDHICELIDSNAPCQPSPGGSSELLLNMTKYVNIFQRYSKYFV